MLRAMPSAPVPPMTGTLISTGSLPSPGVTRKSRSPLAPALPVEAMLHVPDNGGLFAPKALLAPNARPTMEAAMEITTRLARDFMAPPGRRAPADSGAHG